MTVLLLAISGATAAPREDMPVWRVQLEIDTCDVAGAGTDDTVIVKLNTANLTRIDYAQNDFEQGSMHVYDLLQTHVRRLRDIKMLYISKLHEIFSPDPDLCIAYIRLTINGRPIYDHTYANGAWLRTVELQPITIESDLLRLHPLWLFYEEPPLPTRISSHEIASRLEGLIGHYYTATTEDGFPTPLAWDDDAGLPGVEVWRTDENTLHIDLDLEYHVGSPCYCVVGLDVDVDVRVECRHEKMTLTVLNPIVIDPDVPIIPDSWVASKIKQVLRRLTKSGASLLRYETDAPCVPMTVTADGSIDIEIDEPPCGTPPQCGLCLASIVTDRIRCTQIGEFECKCKLYAD